MLAGVRPFDAGTFSELARKAQTEPPPSLRLYRPDTPEGLERVILRALAKTPEERWPNAESFAAALVPFGGRVVDAAAEESESLTMDLVKLRARERKREPAPTLNEGRKARQPDSEDFKLERMSVDREERRAARPTPYQAPAQAQAVVADAAQGRRAQPAQATRAARAEKPELDAGALAASARTAAAAKRPSLPPPAFKAREAVHAGAAAARATAHAAVARPVAGAISSKPPKVPEPAPGAGAFEGSVGLAILRFVSRRYGERSLKEVLDSLPPETLAVFTSGVAPESYLPLEAVCRLVEAIDAKLGRDDLHLIADCGRAVADGTCDQLKRVGPAAPPPELLLTELPGFVERLVRGVKCRVRSVGRGYGRLELDEPANTSSLTLCVLIVGFLDRTLSRFGAREVEVNLVNCRYLGDDENLYDISWLIT